MMKGTEFHDGSGALHSNLVCVDPHKGVYIPHPWTPQFQLHAGQVD